MSDELGRLVSNLGLASAMVAVTVLMHFWGLVLLTRLITRYRGFLAYGQNL